MSHKIRCAECGKRGFSTKNLKNKFSTPWADYPLAFLTTDLELSVCDHCGNYRITGDEGEKIDSAMEASVRSQASFFTKKIQKEAKISGKQLALILGISPEYLSKILNEKKTPSFSVWNFLKIIATDPVKITEELDPKWDFRNQEALRIA